MHSVVPDKDKLVGELLLEHNFISRDRLQIAVEQQQLQKIDSAAKNITKIGTILRERGFVNKQQLGTVLTQQSGFEFMTHIDRINETDINNSIGVHFCKKNRILIHSVGHTDLSIITAYPHNVSAIDYLTSRYAKSKKINILIADDTDIDYLIKLLFCDSQTKNKSVLVNHTNWSVVPSSKNISQVDSDSATKVCTVTLLNSIVNDAISKKVTDIHFEPQADFFGIRFRIDGILYTVKELHQQYYSAIVVRIKVLANLNIGENRLPQDGQFTHKIDDQSTELRVSTFPTVRGESIVLRILDKNRIGYALKDLGFGLEDQNILTSVINNPFGMILISGPTGSGKTTTLYALLALLNDGLRNIITLEQPVEIPVRGLRQCSINDNGKIDFASGLNAILRQDPDVILVGEIRDKRTARIALRAAMTGHLLLSTIHANSAIGILSRLADLELKEKSISANVISLIGQRLVRLLCPHCKAETPLKAWQHKILHSRQFTVPKPCYSANGCEQCRHTGYLGRTAVIEIVNNNSKVKQLIHDNASQENISSVAKQSEFVPLETKIYKLFEQGQTSFSEMLRTVNLV